MKKNGIENFRRVLSRRGMYVRGDSLDQVFGLVGGFDAASDPSILDGFREWILENNPQCDAQFGWTILVMKILPRELNEKDAVDAFLGLLTKFLDKIWMILSFFHKFPSKDEELYYALDISKGVNFSKHCRRLSCRS